MMLPHTTNNTSIYTCLTCQIQFPSAELQRMHMKTEWHRYNLKRRVAQLPPVSSEIFQLKIANSKEAVQYDDFGFVIEDPIKKKSKKNNVKKGLRYDLLQRGRGRNLFSGGATQPDSSREVSPAVSERSAFSLGTLKSHSEYEYDTDDLRSEISKNANTKLESDYHTDDYISDEYQTTDIEEQDDIEEKNEDEPLELTVCFYCGATFDNLDDNISHMFTNHGLYIPDYKYLSDKEGLIRLLSDTVVLDKECLKCGFRSNTLLGIRQHIAAKGHACIPYETKEERALFRRFYDFNISDEEGEVEDEKDVEIEEEGEYHEDEDSEYTTAVLDSSGVELALPNGSRLGHRSMTRYYRQNFPRSDRRLSEGERTLSVINNENDRLLKLQETAKHNKEVKELNRINSKITNKQLSNNILKYQNNLEHYRNQRFG